MQNIEQEKLKVKKWFELCKDVYASYSDLKSCFQLFNVAGVKDTFKNIYENGETCYWAGIRNIKLEFVLY